MPPKKSAKLLVREKDYAKVVDLIIRKIRGYFNDTLKVTMEDGKRNMEDLKN